MQLSFGLPTTKRTKGFSLTGLLSIEFKKFIGLGVCVNIDRPEICRHVMSIPVAIPTDSFT